jgi:hypothetical protein
MEQVFGSAYCTIAASSAEDWTKGFLEWKSTRRSVQDVLDALKRWKSTPRFVRIARRWKPARFIEKALERSEYPVDYTKDVDAARLNQRAWVLQERVLSRRTIYFTESHTYLESSKRNAPQHQKRGTLGYETHPTRFYLPSYASPKPVLFTGGRGVA